MLNRWGNNQLSSFVVLVPRFFCFSLCFIFCSLALLPLAAQANQNLQTETTTRTVANQRTGDNNPPLAHKTAVATNRTDVKKILVITQTGIAIYQNVFNSIKQHLTTANTDLILMDIDDPQTLQSAHQLNPELTVTIGSKSTAIAAEHLTNQPVLFSYVFNPAQFGLNQKSNFSGVAATIDPALYLKKALIIQPRLKKIGLLYDPQKHQVFIEQLTEQARHYGITILAEPITITKKFPAKLKSLMQQEIDLFFIVNLSIYRDAEIFKYLLTRLTLENQIPCVSYSTAIVRSGAYWGLQITPEKVGQDTAQLIDNYFVSKQLPRWIYSSRYQMSVNKNVAQKVKLTLPAELLNNKEVIQYGN